MNSDIDQSYKDVVIVFTNLSSKLINDDKRIKVLLT